MTKPAYSRVILKLSGDSFKGDREFGIDADTLQYISTEIKNIVEMGVEVGVVVGGGNIWRGADHEKRGMDRSTADFAGMLATIMNALALQDALESVDITVRTQSAISMPSVISVPICLPERIDFRFPDLKISNTTIGRELSMHNERAVLSSACRRCDNAS